MVFASVLFITSAVLASPGGAELSSGEARQASREISSRQVTAARALARFPAGLSFSLTAPPAFTDMCCLKSRSGRWIGPSLTLNGRPVTKKITLVWRLDESVRAPSVDAAARRALRHGWPTEEAGVVFVPHITGDREVGTIPGSYLLTRASDESRYEIAFALPLGHGLYATIEFENPSLARNTASTTDVYAIDGQPTDDWIKRQLATALAGIKLEGNLWPAAITLRTRAGGRALSGSVTDSFGHPLATFSLSLQRKLGAPSRWVSVRTVATGGTGRFSIRGMQPGVYRVSGASAGVVVRSGHVILRDGTQR